MNQRSNRPETFALAAPYITLVLAAWLMASAAANYANQATPSYFTVSHAGLEGFFPLLLGWSGLGALFIGVWTLARKSQQKMRQQSYPGSARSTDSPREIPGRLLFAAWLLFSHSLFSQLGSSLTTVSLLVVNLIALALARDIYRSAWKSRWLPDVCLALAGIGLGLFNLKMIPWPGLWQLLVKASEGSATRLAFLLLLWLAFALLLGFILFKSDSTPFSAKLVPPLAITVFLLLSVLIGRILYARVVTMSTPTYDFNLFAQMFYNLAETLQPITTLERNMPLSHFKVHLSPVYYLMLPVYLVFKSPESLNVFQALIVASGVFPMILIARRLKLPSRVQAFFTLIFLVSTPLITSNFYDLHENCFLVPFLLWLIYYIEKKSGPGIAVFTLLTLAVKEDAALYIWALAAFMIFERRLLRQGITMLLVSSGYFVWAVTYLNEFGDGAMTGRFHNLIGVPEWSLLSVPYSLWRNPGFVLAKIFQPAKLTYLIQMLAPLGFMPLLNRSLSRWILVVPFLLMNMMVDYPFQFNIRFQYNYGPYILLFYLAMLWVSDLCQAQPDGEAASPGPAFAKSSPQGSASARHRRGISPSAGNSRGIPAPATVLFALAISSGLFLSSSHLLDYESYPQQLRKDAERLSSMKRVMDAIPESSSVLASDFLTGYLSQRRDLYDISYNVTESSYYPADFIVIDLRPGYEGGHEGLVPRFLGDGYRIRQHRAGEILLLEQTGSPPLDQD